MSYPLTHGQSETVVGLGTWTHTVTNSGFYEVSVRSSILPGSGLSIVVQHNGSTVKTVSSPAAQATHLEAVLNEPNAIYCAANDTISVVLSSSAAIDQGLNVVQSLINIFAFVGK